MDTPTKNGTGNFAAAIGAIVIHPAVGLVVFVVSAIQGCKPFMPDGAKVGYGLEGGGNGVEWLMIFYFFSVGIIPIIISMIGAVIGVVLFKRFKKP